MKVFYQGPGAWKNSPRGLPSEPNLLSLSGNSWDDYGTKTTLNASLYFNGERLDFDFDIKILIEGSSDTADTLSEMKAKGWNGFFPIPSYKYISIPSEIEFYSIVVSKLGENEAIKLIKILSDSGFQKNITKDESFSELLRSSKFTDSLLRESGAVKAFEDGWRIFDKSHDNVNIYDFDLNVLSKDNKSTPIPFRFNSNLLPYDINILINHLNPPP